MLTYKDPFLIAHLVRPFTFVISGGIRPTSIRDQMMRGVLCVDRAIASGIVEPDQNQKIIIVGGGIGGVMAALTSVARGVKTVLIDKNGSFFSLQASCTSRWLDPTQYDWPLEHWDQQEYPWLQEEKDLMPLGIRASTPSNIVLGWRSGFQSYRKSNLLTEMTYAEAIALNDIRTPESPERVEVVVLTRHRENDEPVEGSVRGAMVIFARGSAPEGVEKGGFSSYAFWNRDPYVNIIPSANGEPDQATRQLLSTQRVFISGGGDGALQDFLRIVTDRISAREIYLALSENMPDAVRNAWQSVKLRLVCAEDQAQRALSWGTFRSNPPVANDPSILYDHNVLQSLQLVYQQAIELFQQEDVWPHISSALDRMVENAPAVTLAYPCTHFGQCYTLNHLLVLLIAKYFQRNGCDHVQLLSTQKLISVVTVDSSIHHCEKNADECFGKPHTVTTRSSICGGSPASTSNPGAGDGTISGEYDVIILRHGPGDQNAASGSIPLDLPPVPFPRQLLPYHLPVTS